MSNGISRRNLIKSVGAISMATVLGPAEHLFSAALALTGAPAQQELILNFRGLWAFVVGKNRITAVTARIGEHSYYADQRHLDEGQYTLSGVKGGSSPKLAGELVVCKVNDAGDMTGRYLQMELPFPNQIEGSPCLVQAKFSGTACRTQPAQFPIAHAFHYSLDANAKPRLEPWQDWPQMGYGSKLEVQIKAEPPCRVRNANHSYDAFKRLMQLFPTVSLTLDQVILSKSCPKPKSGSCLGPGVDVDPDNLSNPENCIQVWVQPG
jgi:hypothetical protein